MEYKCKLYCVILKSPKKLAQDPFMHCYSMKQLIVATQVGGIPRGCARDQEETDFVKILWILPTSIHLPFVGLWLCALVILLDLYSQCIQMCREDAVSSSHLYDPYDHPPAKLWG